MRAETLAAFLEAQSHHHAFDAVAALERNRAFAAWHFGCSFALEPGATADLVAFDYRSPTPLEPSNLAGHLLFGLPQAPARHVVVDGRVVLRDGRARGVDEDELLARARHAAKKLWSKMQ
jgi:cytosine/adenosine deaminase-related metal-dependent hydrolase